jgi:hypothetical protein
MAKSDKTPTTQKREIKLKVSVDLLGKDASTAGGDAAVYAFTKGGRMIARANLSDDGIAVLPVPVPGEASVINVVAGPASDAKPATMTELLRRGGQRQAVRVSPDIMEASAAFTVIKDHWACWFLSRCYVPGRLVKRTELDGMQIDLPVCGVEIEVYEVDPIPLIITRLPDNIIARIRRWVLEPDPRPIDVHLPERRLPPIPRPPQPFSKASIALTEEMDRPVATPEAGFAAGGGAEAPAELRIAAQTASIGQFRDALMRAPDLSRFMICRFFPGGVSKQLVATATTDDCGKFRAVFFRGCANPDKPDLYFVAKRKIGFFTITIHGPTPVACYTRWNYVCGTDVELVTTHALAPTCPPCQPIEAPADDWVAVMHIGNLPLSRIRGASPNAAIQASTTGANKGLVFLNEDEALAAATFDGRPMGGLLRPHLEFDNGLRSKGVEYYQFSWRKGTSGDFQPLTHEIHRHYSYEVAGVPEPVMVVYPLGPKNVGGKSLFEIPPALPPHGQWVVPDIVENNTSAKFPSDVHAPPADAGTYQLKLDLFDGAGNLIDIDAAATKTIFVVPEELDLSKSATVHTENADTLGMVYDDDGDGLRSFILELHIDNTPCEAAVDPAELTSPANACGVLLYGLANTSAIVTMPFAALHDNGFATYSFSLKRGVTGLPVPLSYGGADPLVHPRALTSGTLVQTASIATLTAAYPAQGLPQCDMAAFSESVRVWAMATNGWQRLSGLDAYDHGAFVLSPEPATP